MIDPTGTMAWDSMPETDNDSWLFGSDFDPERQRVPKHRKVKSDDEIAADKKFSAESLALEMLQSDFDQLQSFDQSHLISDTDPPGSNSTNSSLHIGLNVNHTYHYPDATLGLSTWLANTGTAAAMTMRWASGERTWSQIYSNDRVANAMRNSMGVENARNFFYAKYKGVSSVVGLSVTNYGAKFRLAEFIDAGLDPIEQYIGSYSIDIRLVGIKLQYTLKNTTSFTSLSYGVGPNWIGGPMGNFGQYYIFTEPLDLHRLR